MPRRARPQHTRIVLLKASHFAAEGDRTGRNIGRTLMALVFCLRMHNCTQNYMNTFCKPERALTANMSLI